MAKLKVLELFAGIGGMHRACQLFQTVNDIELEVVAAVDVNTTANIIYRHNAPETNHWQRNITGISSKEINKLSPDMILMSPPCQPHTRQGKRKDTQDPRSDALKHILELIPSLQSVKYILLENVQGFEVSESRKDLMSVLGTSGFHIQEFLINPSQIGIPNSRLRYYLVAKRIDLPWRVDCGQLQEDFSNLQASVSKLQQFSGGGTIEKYIQAGDNSSYLVEDKALIKYGKILDIVNSNSDRSCCFTKAYGQYYEGTGSVLQQSGDLDAAYAQAELAQTDADICNSLRTLQLRFFTPQEISLLLGFPPSFSFPEEATRKQRYKTLGNSLNVIVVAVLLDYMLS